MGRNDHLNNDSATMANMKINEEFNKDRSNPSGISPALLLNNAPLVDTDDLFLGQKEEER
ncbi:hypothetical protein [Bacillus pinisoli]|uniref:hypothetical protein n=1 Tax=Bacillus pinisoli TaxID=2901866 RepID=UPI001FF35717|nr:hypothetical protein [Bacillus pinisoli]